MSIGSTIKRLRRKKDITQEQLAEYLGITSRAVSQWECDRTMPDISQLPALCNLFNISSDELLEIDIQQKEKRIRDICAEAESYDSRGYKKEAYDILERGLREFPNSYAVMTALMHEAFYLMYDDSCDESKRNKYKSNAIYFGEQILGKSLNDDLRYSAIQTLCMIYSQNNEQDRAQELAKKLPTMVTSREFINLVIFKGSEGYRCEQKLIDNLIDALVNHMCGGRIDDDGNPFYSEAETALLRDKAIAFISLMYENEDFGFANTRLADLHTSQANYYAALSDKEKTIYHLSRAAHFAIAFIKHTKESSFVHTSLLLRGYETCGSSFISSESDNDASLMLNDLNSLKYDFIRDTAEYDEIVKMLKEYAGKWDINN